VLVLDVLKEEIRGYRAVIYTLHYPYTNSCDRITLRTRASHLLAITPGELFSAGGNEAQVSNTR
jgi:hypothetical protein